MDPNQFATENLDAVLGEVQPGGYKSPTDGTPGGQMQGPSAWLIPPDDPRVRRTPEEVAAYDKPLQDPTAPILDAPIAGAATAIAETVDFVTGGGEKSEGRKAYEKRQEALKKESVAYGVVSGVSQFATGMLGLGKLQKVLGVAGPATRAAKTAFESGKAAAVGAVAFDPHAERLSNIVESFPALSNPVSQFLQAKPGDSAALGRVKNALESIGVDAVLVGTFTAATKLYKALRSGDSVAIKEATEETAAAVKAGDIPNVEPTPTPPSAAMVDTASPPPVASSGAVPRVDVPAVTPPEPYKEFVIPERTVGPPLEARSILNNFDEAMVSGDVNVKRFSAPPSVEEIDSILKAGEEWERRQVAEVFGQDRVDEIIGWMRRGSSKLDDLAEEYGPRAEQVLFGTNDGRIVDTEGLTRLRERLAGVEYAAADKDIKRLGREVAWAAPKLPPLSKAVADHTDTEREAILVLSHGYNTARANGLDFDKVLREALAYTGGRVGGDASDAKLLLKTLGDYNRMITQGGDASPRPPGAAVPDAPSLPAPTAPEAPLAAEAVDASRLQPGAAPDVPVTGADPQITVQPGNVPQPSGLPKAPSLMDVTEDNLQTILNGTMDDVEAFKVFGSWQAAVDQGHVFSTVRGKLIPWQKLGENAGVEVGAFIERISGVLEAQMNAAKGGGKAGVMSDATVNRMVTARAALWGEDPAAIFGMLERAGTAAKTMAANMEASFLVAQRSMMDSYAMAARIEGGFLDEWGGDKAAAGEALRQMVEVAATAFGHAQSLRSNAGRTLRRLRSDFAIDPEKLAAIRKLDPEQLAKILSATEGNPKALAKAMEPTLLASLVDKAQFLLVNNLLWGLRTHFVNFTTNAYMVAVRPLERVIGSYITKDSATRQQALRQYTYMGSTLSDAWSAAVQTWRTADSVLTPHSTESLTVGGDLGKQIATAQFKPWDSVSNVLHNALMVAVPKVLGTPTRALGTVDELVKQVVYRSNVQAKAHVEGLAQGLKGADLSDFVSKKLFDAFDDVGKAVDPVALREAQISTFQQDLLKGTMGRALSNMASDQKWVKFILPFIKTPVNVFRMGVKMTPGINMLQGEYREMIRGSLGPEAQAQAIGQMAMGSLLLGTAAMHAAQGTITGGGPSDPKRREALQAAGWQPYSFAYPNQDGTVTYVPYGRYDPVSMPLGIVADLVDVIHAAEDDETVLGKASDVGSALLVSVAKQLSNKTFLLSINTALQAVTDPDRKGEKFAGRTVANFVPLASGLRFINPDPNLREARDIADYIMATIPGLSEKLPPKRDAFGEPISVNKGLWSTGELTYVDAEMVRMGEESKFYVGAPSPTISGVDLRDITMVDGRNAYDVYQDQSRRPGSTSRTLKEAVGKVMLTEAYKNAPDGEAGIRGTKLWILAGTIQRYREAGLKRVKADPNVRKALAEKNNEVRAAYALRNNPGNAPDPAKGLSAVGEAFGIDLSGLTGN